MMSLSRMIPLGLVTVGLCTSGCSAWHSPFGNQSRSARAGNGASVEKPNADGALGNGKLAAKRGAKRGDAMHYYTNRRVAMVARPTRYSANELARVEVWWTDNNGFHWRKAGRFEQGQAFFPLDVKEDGDYGIRFVGPGEEPAQRVLAFPERTYHVDTVQPEVQVLVDPQQTDYHVGDLVSIDWMVQDFQLEKFPVTIEVLYDRGDADTGPIEFQRDLPDEGSVTYRIPPEALGREITFRVEAKDRSGNVGLAFTKAYRIVEDPMAAAVAKAEAEAEAKTNESEIENDSTDRVAVVPDDPEEESDTALPPVAVEEPVLVVGPILVPVEDDTQEAVAAAAIESEPTVAKTSEAEPQRAAHKAMLAEATRLVAELENRAMNLASRAATAMSSVVDGWAVTAKTASASNSKTTQSPPPVAIVEAPVVEAGQSPKIENEAVTQAPVTAAVAVVESDNTEVQRPVDARTPDPQQTAPTFAVVDQPADESAEDVALHEPLIATATQTEVAESDTRPAGSTFLEIGPQIVMVDEPCEEEPTPLSPSDESTAVAIGETDQSDLSPDAPQIDQRQPDATSLAAADGDATDDAEESPADRITQRSSALPFATAMARLPAIDSHMMDEDSAPEDVPADDTTTRDQDIAETTEPTPEEDAHPQVSALASAEQENQGEEQLTDATIAEEIGDANDEQEQDADTIETVTSAEQSEGEEPVLPAMSIESLTAADPTRGNGLMVPLPATVEDEASPRSVTGHPWRILGRQSGAMEKAVWTLPDRQADVRWRPVFTGRFLADDPALRDVAKPGDATLPTLAGATEEAIDGEASDEP